MMEIKSFTFNDYQENTYLIIEGKHCIIIDPGNYYDNERKCKASSKYPFIYQWIYNNYVALLSLIVAILFLIFFNLDFSYFNLVKIVLFLIFISAILPQLFKRADGDGGRKYYRILPKDPDEPIGIFDLSTICAVVKSYAVTALNFFLFFQD